MAILDSLKSLVGGHKKEAEKGVAEAGKAVDEKTGGAHSAEVNTAEKKVDEEIEGLKEGGTQA